MSMDGLALHAVRCELLPLVGGKIDRVQQPDRDALLLTVRQSSEVSGIMYLTPEEMRAMAPNFAVDSVTAFEEILRRAREQGVL